MPRRARIFFSLLGLVALVVTAMLLAPVGVEGGVANDGRSLPGVVAIGEDVIVDEPLEGSVQILAGSVTIRERVGGDVIAFGADVILEDGARIEGDLFCLRGRVQGVQSDRIGGEIYAPASVMAALEGVSKGSRPIVAAAEEPFSLVTLALKLSLLLLWLVVAVALTLVEAREIRSTSVEVRVSPFYSFALGLVGFTSFVLTAIVLSYLIPYVIGLLLLVVLALFAVLAKVWGMIAIFHAIGSLVAAPKSRQSLAERRWIRGDLAMVIIGLLILGALRLIPVVGDAIWMTASLVGVGVALLTRFGRRDPAFLAWRPAEESRATTR